MFHPKQFPWRKSEKDCKDEEDVDMKVKSKDESDEEDNEGPSAKDDGEVDVRDIGLENTWTSQSRGSSSRWKSAICGWDQSHGFLRRRLGVRTTVFFSRNLKTRNQTLECLWIASGHL